MRRVRRHLTASHLAPPPRPLSCPPGSKGYFSGKCLDCPSKDKPQRPDHDHWRPPFWRPPVGASCATVSPSSRCDCCLYKDKPLRDAW